MLGTIQIFKKLTTSDRLYFKISNMLVARISSTDVECSFSKFKMLLPDTRRKFTFENLKKTLIVQCNAAQAITIGNHTITRGRRSCGHDQTITAKIIHNNNNNNNNNNYSNHNL